MPSDAELRAIFREAPAPAPALDAASIIRRSRRRRLPRQIGAGSVLTLAAAGIGVAGVTGIPGLNLMGARTSGDLVESAADAPSWVKADSGSGADSGAQAPYAVDGAGIDRCGMEQGNPESNPWQLQMQVALPERNAKADRSGTANITIRNDGPGPIVGTVLDAAAYTLWQGGVAVAIGSGELIGADGQEFTAPLRLDSGESLTLQSRFALLSCRPGQTTVDPGHYLMGTELDFTSEDGVVATLDGEPARIVLR